MPKHHQKPDSLPVFDRAEDAATVGRELYDALKSLRDVTSRYADIAGIPRHFAPALRQADTALAHACGEVS